MGIEELKLIAEIVGGLESTGITGFMVFIGAQVLQWLMTAVLMGIVIWCAYKLLNRLVNTANAHERAREIAELVDASYIGSPTRSEWGEVIHNITELHEYKGKYEEQRRSLKDYMGRLVSLSEDYETVWNANEKLKEELEAAQKHCIRLEEEAIAKARKADPSINSDWDRKPEEDTDEHKESV